MAHKWEMSMERWWNGTDGEMNMGEMIMGEMSIEHWWNGTDGGKEYGGNEY